jgi:hypothetical protein
VIGRIAFDLVLRLIRAGMNGVSLELNRGCDNFRNLAAYAAGFRIPTYMIALLEPPFRHDAKVIPVAALSQAKRLAVLAWGIVRG